MTTPSCPELPPADLEIEDIIPLLTRLQLWPQILRRQEEESIAQIVDLDPSFLDDCRNKLLGDSSLDDYLKTHRLSPLEFDMQLRLPECLRLFSEQHFGPGIEEAFLSAQGGHDQIIYSLIRVKDNGLARELWIRLEEGEDTFSSLPQNLVRGLKQPNAV